MHTIANKHYKARPEQTYVLITLHPPCKINNYIRLASFHNELASPLHPPPPANSEPPTYMAKHLMRARDTRPLEAIRRCRRRRRATFRKDIGSGALTCPIQHVYAVVTQRSSISAAQAFQHRRHPQNFSYMVAIYPRNVSLRACRLWNYHANPVA